MHPRLILNQNQPYHDRIIVSHLIVFRAPRCRRHDPVFASGSYSGRPPKPPVAAGGEMKIDREKYGLDQKVYESQIKLTDGGDAGAQVERLKSAQAKLRADAMKLKNLPALARKLSAAELGTLDYFVSQRFEM